ncbi:DgyrCDS10913 [Dimorphilus gyrociliatus]|uniref:DgyrCDS10913 n=1 Tax=Dimorphilus gyrociliatus TaxID=2664684 RepID=A0A7I8W348_9ANNE|nr:DgyrCDS10913 [Dimorphilus gyrociliatus]
METLLEQQRRFHEERERLMDTMAKEMLYEKKMHRERINSDHRLKLLLDRYTDATSELKELYDDKDGAVKQEIAALSGPNEFGEFYMRLKSIKEFHRKHPNEQVSVPMAAEFEELDRLRENPEMDTVPLVEFSDEEGYGKYLDLHHMYQMFINLKGVEKADYISYLTSFDRLFEISKERKNNAYRDYLKSLLDYLNDFLLRVQPLFDINQEMDIIINEFKIKWMDGTFPGWPKETAGALTHTGAHLDLSAFSTPDELASLGLDRLKSALMALGLKCGGTLEERAKRLFATKGKSLDELDPSLFARTKTKEQEKKENEALRERHREIALLEAQVYRFSELLSEQRAATRDNVQRKQARGADERDESDDEEEPNIESDDDNDDDIPYNPKNLPLGWDGKPIPYWLYKLHGLNLSYSCEICGNYTYKGPKAFQRHFSEWRHAHGMRCLGIPNTAHFANVTHIEDAIALWQKLKVTKDVERWKPETEEEYEDSAGNVVNKKTFDDLKRQGLL